VIARALALAVSACLLAAPSALAAGHAVTLSDPQETPCSVAPCTPDLSSIAVYYDTDGTFYVSVTFYGALAPYTASGPLRVRVNIGRGLAGDGSCTPSGSSAALTGTSGDVRIEVGAYNGGGSPSPVANGSLFRVGSAGSIALTRSISPNLKTLTLSTTDPALTGLDLRCTQADLADDTATVAVRDPVPLAWFPGYGPSTPPPADPTAPGGAAPGGTNPAGGTTPGGGGTTPAAPGGTGPALVAAPAAAAPKLLRAPVARRVKKAPARLTCSTGRWRGATRFAFRWLRNGRLIARAATRAYRLRPADHGRALRCRVTASNAAHSTISRSRALSIH